MSAIDFLAPYKCHGIEFSYASAYEEKGDCPFCDKIDHFFVNTSDGRYHCKRCGRAGNIITYLGEYAEKVHVETHQKDWDRIAKDRGMPYVVFKGRRMGWTGEQWLIPVFSDSGTVRDIRIYRPGSKIITTKGCKLQLYGLQELAKVLQIRRTVWICEGEWDAMALHWLLFLSDRHDDIVTAVPGAGTFKKDWIPWYVGHDVIICGDNDEAGDRMQKHCKDMLTGMARTLRYVHWPESRPKGWDIRDFVRDGWGKEISAIDAILILESLINKYPRHDAPPPSPKALTARSAGGRALSFDDLITAFKKWIKLDKDFEDALAICMAIGLANDIAGDPLWMYLVAPPGGGKSVILVAMQASDRVVFRSSLTPASLVSGFNTHPDPSLIPQLDRKTAVFKDGTEILAMQQDARREIYSILRGAFDGSVSRSYGNGVVRDYKVRFNMIMGMTPAVHGDHQATMGERFLKFESKEGSDLSENKIRKAIENISKEVSMEHDLGEACRHFLEMTVMPEAIPPIHPKVVDLIISLAQITSILRAQVEREQFGDHELKYRPSHEIGTRVAKQLAKLGQMLTFVYGVDQIDERICNMLRRVAKDTTIGFHYDMICELVKVPMTREALSKRIHIPLGTTARRLQDLEQLNIIERIVINDEPRRTGPIPVRWQATTHMIALWNRAFSQPVANMNHMLSQKATF